METIRSVLYIQDNGITAPCSMVVNSKVLKEKTAEYNKAYQLICKEYRDSFLWKLFKKINKINDPYFHIQPQLFKGTLFNSSFPTTSYLGKMPFELWISRTSYKELSKIIQQSTKLLGFKIDKNDELLFIRAIEYIRIFEIIIVALFFLIIVGFLIFI